jgi:hypothetical protein
VYPAVEDIQVRGKEHHTYLWVTKILKEPTT